MPGSGARRQAPATTPRPIRRAGLGARRANRVNHLLSVIDVGTGCVQAQREVSAKTNEIPEMNPARTWLSKVHAVVLKPPLSFSVMVRSGDQASVLGTRTLSSAG